MKNHCVCVISKEGHPLMPTKRFGKVRRLLKSGKAKVVELKPFTIQLEYKTANYVQGCTLGIDPGGEKIGISVRKDNGEIIELGELESRTQEIPEKMSERKMYRQSRRRHRRLRRQRRAKKNDTIFKVGKKEYKIKGTEENIVCKWIKPKHIKFLNRKRAAGWLTPTANHLLETHKNIVKKIAQRIFIKEICVEYAKFDLQKLENPEIEGKDYQNGPRKGFGNVQDYVLCRDKHICALCGKGNRALQVHHVIWSSEGGADTPENLLTLCEKCHGKVHQNTRKDEEVKKLFAGIKKRLVHTTLLNIVMPQFLNWLEKDSGIGKISITYGYETKQKRRALNLDKKHYVDAYLISTKDANDIPSLNWKDFYVYQYKQFRRHHRQIIHAVRDRNYKEKKKIVAKNRRKRTGQLVDSLEELVKKRGKTILAKLRVLPGKKVIRSKFNKFRKGDTVEYKGKRYVVKGYGEMGRRLGFVGCKNYVSTKECRLLTRNSGIVCL